MIHPQTLMLQWAIIAGLELNPPMSSAMEIVHEHNLNRDLRGPKPFGIRVRVPAADPFARLLGQDWERYHWYGTRQERDRALTDMAGEHLYSRRGDRPTLIYEPVEQASRGDEP